MNHKVQAEKERIRTLVRASRLQRTPEEITLASAGVERQLRELVTRRGARRVSCFMSTPREPGTHSFLDWAVADNIEVLLPSSRDDGLLDWIQLNTTASGGRGFAIGAFGIDEPIGERLPPEAVGGVDLVITPACAVDQSGVRMGWGRGYFDHTLGSIARLPPVFAAVYDDELFETLPCEAHDVRMSGVVTPTHTLEFTGERTS